MSECVIRPIPLAKGPIEKTIYTYRIGPGQMAEAAYYIWYIEGPKKKTIVDAGVTADILAAGGRFGRTDIQSLEEGMRKIGLKPDDIETVIATHLHHDHIALAASFPNAEIIVQKAELEAARNPHPISAGTYRLQKGIL